jgi:hypothetical protein
MDDRERVAVASSVAALRYALAHEDWRVVAAAALGVLEDAIGGKVDIDLTEEMVRRHFLTG